jgi:hypothetical protein
MLTLSKFCRIRSNSVEFWHSDIRLLLLLLLLLLLVVVVVVLLLLY